MHHTLEFKGSTAQIHNGNFSDGWLDDTFQQNRPTLFVTSPPYNIGPKHGKIILFRGIHDYADVLDEEKYQQWQAETITWMINSLADNGNVLYNVKQRFKNRRAILPEDWIPREYIKHRINWFRKSTHNHDPSRPYPEHENIYWLVKDPSRPKPLFKNHPPLWEDNKVKGIGDTWVLPPKTTGVDKDLKHPAPMPLLLARQMIIMWSNPGDLICDPFLGSGTTMIAALMEGRDFVGTDVERKFVDMTKLRFERELIGIENE